MKLHAFLLVAAACAAGGCATKRADVAELSRQISQQGITLYETPRGNPAEPAEWKSHGPGAVRHPSAGTVTANASRMIGQALVDAHASLKEKTPLETLNRSEVSEQDIKILGGGPIDVVARIKADVSAARSTNASIVMGRVWEVAMSEADLIAECRKNAANNGLTSNMIDDLCNGGRDLIVSAIYAEGMTFKFASRQSSEASASAETAPLPQTGSIQIAGNTYHWTESGLEMREPRFLGYRALPRREVREIFPR